MNGAPGQNKKAVVMTGVAVILLLAVLVSWASFHPRALEPVKKLTVSVTHSDGSVLTIDIETTARYLAEALEPRMLLETEETDAGIVLLAVDGEYADPEAGTFWLYTVNGSTAEGPAAVQPIEDGDTVGFYLLNY